jgi:hypothetical protein
MRAWARANMLHATIAEMPRSGMASAFMLPLVEMMPTK